MNSPARHTPLPAGPQTKRGQVTSARIERKFEVNNCWPSQAHPAPTNPARPKQHVFGWDEKVSSASLLRHVQFPIPRQLLHKRHRKAVTSPLAGCTFTKTWTRPSIIKPANMPLARFCSMTDPPSHLHPNPRHRTHPEHRSGNGPCPGSPGNDLSKLPMCSQAASVWSPAMVSQGASTAWPRVRGIPLQVFPAAADFPQGLLQHFAIPGQRVRSVDVLVEDQSHQLI